MITFNIPMGKSSVVVCVHETLEEMDMRVEHKNKRGVTLVYHLPQVKTRIHLLKDEVDMGIVAHEIMHAFFHYWSKQGTLEEEESCEAIEIAHREFWIKWMNLVQEGGE